MGGGVGVSAHASHRVVTEKTVLAMPECGIGLIPDVGGTLMLALAPGRLGEYLGISRERARQIKDRGLRKLRSKVGRQKLTFALN